MITFQQLSTLIKQGYNEDQIKQLNAIFSPEDGQNPSPSPSPNPAPSPAPAPAPDNPQTSPAPGTNPPSQQTAPTQEPQTQQRGGTAPQYGPVPESETQKMLKEMLGLMRNGAINSIQQPTTQQVTTESILAKVLEP